MTSVAASTRAWADARSYPLTYFETIGSTNDEAKRGGARECLYLAAHQTAGRGRGGNHWVDVGAGQILLSTWSLLAPAPPRAITGPRVGLALHRALVRAWPHVAWALKAPNDLFVGKLKLAGLLIEVVSTGDVHHLVVGLGLNVLAHPLDTSTDLAVVLGGAPDEPAWFEFLDAWRDELRVAARECTHETLAPAARRELRLALNANGARAFDVTDVSPEGDLVHAGGVVRWTEL